MEPLHAGGGSQRLRGLQSSMAALEEGASLRILLVHGVGCHKAGWSAPLQAAISKVMGLTEVNYSQADREDTSSARQVISFSDDKRVLSMSQDDVPPSAADWCGSLSRLDKHKDGDNGELPTLIITNYQQQPTNRRVSFYEVTWSPLLLRLKRDQLGYDIDKKLTKSRAIINRWIKDDLVDSLFSDAVYYMGSGRKAVLDIVAFSLCRLWQSQTQLSLTEQTHCTSSSDAYLEGIGHNRYAIITQSMGSQIVFDALRHDSLIRAVDQGLQRTDSIFMLSNQLPLLELGQRRREIQLSSDPSVVGKKFDEWLAAFRTAPDSADFSAEVRDGLTALQLDLDGYRHDFAVRLYQSEYQKELDRADQAKEAAKSADSAKKATILELENQQRTTRDSINDLTRQRITLSLRLSAAKKAHEEAHTQLTNAQQVSEAAARALKQSRQRLLSSERLTLTGDTNEASSAYSTSVAALLDSAREGLKPCFTLRTYSVEPGNPELEELVASRLRICDRVLVELARVHATYAFVRSHTVRSTSSPTVGSGDPIEDETEHIEAGLTELARRYRETQPSNSISSYVIAELFRADPSKPVGGLMSGLQLVSQQETALSGAIATQAGIQPTKVSLETAIERGLEAVSVTLAQDRRTAQRATEDEAHKRAVADKVDEQYDLGAMQASLSTLEQQQKARESDLRTIDGQLEKVHGEQKHTAGVLEQKTAAAQEIRSRYESPRDDGLAGFLALIQQGPGPLKAAQAQEVERRSTEEVPQVQRVLLELSHRLGEYAASIRKPDFVAFNDPNDLLGFSIPDAFAGRYRGAQFINQRVRNSSSILQVLNVYASPERVHSDYFRNQDVLRFIVYGSKQQESGGER